MLQGGGLFKWWGGLSLGEIPPWKGGQGYGAPAPPPSASPRPFRSAVSRSNHYFPCLHRGASGDYNYNYRHAGLCRCMQWELLVVQCAMRNAELRALSPATLTPLHCPMSTASCSARFNVMWQAGWGICWD